MSRTVSYRDGSQRAFINVIHTCVFQRFRLDLIPIRRVSAYNSIQHYGDWDGRIKWALDLDVLPFKML